MDRNAEAVALFDKRAKDYEDKYMDVALYHDALDQFCSLVQKNAKVLELGCGPGNITRYLLNERPDLRLLGTDLAPNMIELAKVNVPEASFRLMDLREIGMLNDRYDAVVCGFCLPYLSTDEAKALISDASHILLPDGIFYLSTMEGDETMSGPKRSSDGMDEIHTHYYQSEFLTTMMEENGFTILYMNRKPTT